MNDLKFAFRQMLKNPSFTAVAVLTLALVSGANTAMFSVVNAVTLRPLPFPEPGRCMLVEGNGINNFTGPDFRDLTEQNRFFEQLGTYTTAILNLSGGREAERVNGARPARRASRSNGGPETRVKVYGLFKKN